MKNSIPISALMGIIGVVGLLLMTGVASATEVRVELANCGDYLYTDPVYTYGVVTTTTCGSVTTAEVLTEGGAFFAPYHPSLYLNLTSAPGRGVSGRAFIDDSLTFHVAGGGSAVVPARIAGYFSGMLYPQFSVTLALGNYFHEYHGSLTDSIDGNPGSDIYFPQQGDPLTTGAFGSYLIGYDWTVVDGGVYEVFLALKAGASDGASIYIDDPLTFRLPAGVTFTSASNSSYISPVPLPAAVWLLGTGIAGLGGRRWLRRKATARYSRPD